MWTRRKPGPTIRTPDTVHLPPVTASYMQVITPDPTGAKLGTRLTVTLLPRQPSSQQ